MKVRNAVSYRQSRFSRAFVVGAYVPNGGTYMAYHLGCILQRDFGVEAISVILGSESANNGVQRYDLLMPDISLVDLSKTITDDDILIVNPSFSHLLLGWRVSGFKVCYVQGFNTFSVLDRRFDHYVAVSDFVRNFLKVVYDLEVPVIPAFIHLEQVPQIVDWRNRPEFVVLPYRKGMPDIWAASFERLQALLASQAPQIILAEPFSAEHLIPQQQFLAAIGKYRYVLLLSAAEGLSLVALEAMALGTIVVGYDGFGGTQYMVPGMNCAVAPYANIELVARRLIDAVTSVDNSFSMSEKARETARQYTYNAFRQRWVTEFSTIVGQPTRGSY